MDWIRKLTAAALWVIAAAVGVHFIFGPVYGHILDIGLIWRILGWFMTAGVAVVLLTQYTRKRAADSRQHDARVSREYLASNFLFFASIILAIWFLWNWIDSLVIGAANQNVTNITIWAFIDPLFIMVMGITSCYLWRGAKE